MKTSVLLRRAGYTGRLGALLLLMACPGTAQTVPSMTIEIHNNSSRYSLYPVLSTGAHVVDTWMQAILNVPRSEVGDKPFPTPDTFRLYLNPTGVGIPPNGSVTLTLPLYTQLVPTAQINPRRRINMWIGGMAAGSRFTRACIPMAHRPRS
jgi:hypothetical protein